MSKVLKPSQPIIMDACVYSEQCISPSDLMYFTSSSDNKGVLVEDRNEVKTYPQMTRKVKKQARSYGLLPKSNSWSFSF